LFITSSWHIDTKEGSYQEKYEELLLSSDATADLVKISNFYRLCAQGKVMSAAELELHKTDESIIQVTIKQYWEQFRLTDWLYSF